MNDKYSPGQLHDSRGQPFGLDEIMAFARAGFEMHGIVPYNEKSPLPLPSALDPQNHEYRQIILHGPKGDKRHVARFIRPLEPTV